MGLPAGIARTTRNSSKPVISRTLEGQARIAPDVGVCEAVGAIFNWHAVMVLAAAGVRLAGAFSCRGACGMVWYGVVWYGAVR